MSLIVEVIDLLSKKDLKRFINIPWSIYKNDPFWIPPLKMAVADVLNLKSHPFYKTAKVKAFIVSDGGNDLGRILAINNFRHNEYQNTKIGFFGFFESINDQKVANLLFESAESFLKNEGLLEMQGPMNPGTNYECGLLVDGFNDPPQVMMCYNKTYYLNLFSNYNLEKEMDLIAYQTPAHFEMPEIIKTISERTIAKSKLSFRDLNLKKWNQELDLMFEIYNSAWEENWGFVPMTKEEFYHTAKDLKSIINPKLVQVAEVDGKPAGFILTLPDLNQVFQKIPSGELGLGAVYKILTRNSRMKRCRVITMGVKKEFRKMGIETVLYIKNHEAIKSIKKMQEIEMSWILESNLEMNKPLIRMGARPYKKYRIYKKNI